MEEALTIRVPDGPALEARLAPLANPKGGFVVCHPHPLGGGTMNNNVVYRLGFASSLAQARQVVRHGHLHLNGKKVTIPSTLVEVGDVISVAEASRTKKVIVEAIEMAQRRGVPPWMALEREQFRGSLRSLPQRAELTMPISEKLIVEHYSR